jgi:hypothetical protein
MANPGRYSLAHFTSHSKEETMADEQDSIDGQSTLEQGQDPRGDLLKARPGGETDTIEPNPNSGFRDMKPESGYEGTGSEGGYKGGPEGS